MIANFYLEQGTEVNGMLFSLLETVVVDIYCQFAWISNHHRYIHMGVSMTVFPEMFARRGKAHHGVAGTVPCTGVLE